MHPLSIYALTKETNLSSKNIGVVEIMVLHTCDKCLFSKRKWMAMHPVVVNGRKNLNLLPSEDDIKAKKTSIIKEFVEKQKENKRRSKRTPHSEGDNAKLPISLEIKEYMDISGDPQLTNLEEKLFEQTSILAHLLSRYNLVEKLDATKFTLAKDTILCNRLDWQTTCFYNLKLILLELFKGEPIPLPSKPKTNPEIQISPNSSSTDHTIVAEEPNSKQEQQQFYRHSRISLLQPKMSRSHSLADVMVGPMGMGSKSLSYSHLDQLPQTLVEYKPSEITRLQLRQERLGRAFSPEPKVYSPHTLFRNPHSDQNEHADNPSFIKEPELEVKFIPENDDEDVSPLFHDPDKYKKWIKALSKAQEQRKEKSSHLLDIPGISPLERSHSDTSLIPLVDLEPMNAVPQFSFPLTPHSMAIGGGFSSVGNTKDVMNLKEKGDENPLQMNSTGLNLPLNIFRK